ncbi:MAG: DegT/DnrJ/EryC1/StrS family aminotransferase [Acetivibrionales bacterium]|jgi:UDP-2-acetamido-2-deoxy-ribo-hexuluronate aminotransferase
MEFIDLTEQYSLLKNRIDKNIQKVLEHGKYILGPEVTELEEKLGEYTGVKHVISCSSGTDALLMPLMAWGIGRGDAVFTTVFSFIAAAEVICLLGATPVFVDIDPYTYNISPGLLEEAINKTISEGKLKVKAVIPVDLFGVPADYDRIQAIAHTYGLKVLEDAAQGFGSVYKGRKACSFGDAAGTSFFPAKPLGCYGDGGAIFTNDDRLAEELRSIRVHGKGTDKYDNIRTGINGRLDTLQAAILLAKLDVFDDELEARNCVAAKYTSGLSNIVTTPVIPDGLKPCWAQYSVLASDSKERRVFTERLAWSGIPTAIYYPKPLHLQTVYSHLGYRHSDFPVAENISNRVFSLPMHPYLSDMDIEEIVRVMMDYER